MYKSKYLQKCIELQALQFPEKVEIVYKEPPAMDQWLGLQGYDRQRQLASLSAQQQAGSHNSLGASILGGAALLGR